MFVFSSFGLKKIKYHRYFDKRFVFEGESVSMIEEISNNKILPVPWLKVESKIDENLLFGSGSENLKVRHKSLHESVFMLYPFTRIKRIHHVVCAKRGEYNLENVYLSSGSLLGGSGERTVISHSESSLVVYPKIQNVRDLPLKHHNIFGQILMKRWIIRDPFYIAGTNEYTFSEPLNMINWKATARTGALRVHNLDFSSEHKIMLLMNVDLEQDQWTTPADLEIVELLIGISASFVYQALKMGIETGYATNASCRFNEEIPSVDPKSGNEQLHTILQCMSRIRARRFVTFHTFLKNISEKNEKYDYLILSWYDSREIRRYIDVIEKKGSSVLFLSRRDLSYGSPDN